VDLADHLRLRQHEDVVVAFDVVPVAGKARAAVPGLVQPVALDHRAHRAVHDEDAPFEQRGDEVGAVGLHGERFAAAWFKRILASGCEPLHPSERDGGVPVISVKPAAITHPSARVVDCRS